MKEYIFMFLVFLFQNCLAPTFTKEEKQQMAKNNTEMINYRKSQVVEEENDHNDLITLKSYKMTSKFTKEDRKKIREICKKQGIKTKWLYKIFKIESGGNPTAVNKNAYKKGILIRKGSGATGLIGFLPSTANYLGTDTSTLKKMTVLQQLHYVDKYLTKIKNKYKIRNGLDLYFSIFRPEAIGKPDDFIVGHKNSNVTKGNPVFMNKDSTITVKDVKTIISLI